MTNYYDSPTLDTPLKETPTDYLLGCDAANDT
jgi:hypothetical protein